MSDSELVVVTAAEGVTTLRMNNPRKLNGWTMGMMEALRAAFDTAAADEACQVLVLTGTDPYYCAGVNLSATVKLSHPKSLHAMIVERNRGLFEMFLDFPKPIIAAVNGPAIGASVTSATLCDALVASEQATFSTPFAALGVPPEGCSSVLFAQLMGDAADRMLGAEGFKPTAAEALQMGLIDQVVPHEELSQACQALGEAWIAAGRTRTYRGGFDGDTLRRVNAEESVAVADAFLDSPFLQGQYQFLKRKKKRGPAAMFYALWRTRPLWSRLL